MARSNPLLDEVFRGSVKRSPIGRAAMALARVESNAALLRECVRRGDAPQFVSDAYMGLCDSLAAALAHVGKVGRAIDGKLGAGRAVRLAGKLRELGALVHPVRLGADGLGLTRGATIPARFWRRLAELSQERFALLGALDVELTDDDAATRDPIPLTWLRQVVPSRTVAGDAAKLGAYLKRRGVRVFKIAGKLHAERDELLGPTGFCNAPNVAALVRECTP